MASGTGSLVRVLHGVLPIVWFHLMQNVQAVIQSCDSTTELQAYIQTVFPEHSGETQWDQCSYPNPRENPEECGLTTAGWLCDPDGILRQDQIIEVKEGIKEVMAGSDCRCTDGCNGDAHGHPVLVLVMDWIRIANLNDGYCEHTDDAGCELRYPQLEPESRRVTKHEWQSAFKFFGDHVMDHWNIGACGDEVILLVSKKYKRLVLHAGDIAMDLIGEEGIAEVEKAADRHMSLGSVKTAIMEALKVIKPRLEPISRAPYYTGMTFLIIFIILVILLLLFVLTFCACSLYAGKSIGDACQDFGSGDFSAFTGANAKLTERKENGPEEGSPLKEDGVNSSPQKTTEINNSTSPV